MLEGHHYTDWVNEVKALRRSGDDQAAEALLLRLIDVIEDEAALEGWGVAPWYYEQVAIIRAGRGDTVGEVEILERFAAQKHAPGVKPPRLLQRLAKAWATLGQG